MSCSGCLKNAPLFSSDHRMQSNVELGHQHLDEIVERKLVSFFTYFKIVPFLTGMSSTKNRGTGIGGQISGTFISGTTTPTLSLIHI